MQEEIRDSLQDIKKAISGLEDKIVIQQTDVAVLRENSNNIHKRIEKIDKYMFEGNGTKPILSRLDLIEDTLEELDEDVNKANEKMSAFQTEEIKGKWDLKKSIIALLATLISSGIGGAIVAAVMPSKSEVQTTKPPIVKPK